MSYEVFIQSQSFKSKGKSTNLVKLGFDFNNHNPKEEYYKLQSLLYSEYHILCNSMPEIMKKYNIPSSKTLFDLFEKCDIEKRNLSDALMLGVEKFRVPLPNGNIKYKNGWHKTWDGISVYLRSSYEYNFAHKLDEMKIKYDCECLRIKYFSTEHSKYRIAIPDFLLIDYNIIVEIKADYHLNQIEMNDKMVEYKRLGYKALVIKNNNFEGFEDHLGIEPSRVTS